ncbi:MAG: ion transporter, partial [Bacteroidia bacterium]
MRSALIRFFTDDQPVAVVILLNAILLFILSFQEAAPYVFWLELIDTFFLLYFLAEAVLKIRIQGWSTYISQAWNRFDFVIVLFSIPSIILLFYSEVPDDRLAFVFVFRVIRVARFVKFFRFIPNLDELVAGIKRAFKASVFVIIAFIV